jgi:hexosaminidase
MLIQVMNSCWIWPDAQLSNVGGVRITVGALPFNLQLGSELAHIVHRPSSTPGMELQVRLDSCDGELLAALPLGPAKPGLASLSAALPPRLGTHALCFAVAGDKLDPIWAIDEVQLVPAARKGS